MLAASLSLSVVACRGGGAPGSSSYVPAGSTSVSQDGDTGGATPDREGRISSTCGRHIHVVIAGIVDCRFHERGYGDGKFTLHDHTKGIILIGPLEGSRKTKFTITGAVAGRGFFVVRDTHGNYLVVRVRVTV
ncbi:MAG TPA: hypothetical protein VFE16_13995 [Candidatus Cybelea sp.]|nr:hypothetical protein [Candidatus Cybelea sp.]